MSVPISAIPNLLTMDPDDLKDYLLNGLGGGPQAPSGMPSAGLASDLMGTLPQPPGASGLGSVLMQGAQAAPAPSTVPATQNSAVSNGSGQSVTPPQSPRLTDENIYQLGRVLTSECQGICNPEEIDGIGSTLINRMNRAGTDRVADVTGGYSLKKDPSPGMMFTASRLLSGQLGDNTGGATNFYSPQSMPRPGRNTSGWDISGGSEQLPGEPETYRPGFAVKYPQDIVPGVRDWVAKFYTQPGNGRVY